MHNLLLRPYCASADIIKRWKVKNKWKNTELHGWSFNWLFLSPSVHVIRKLLNAWRGLSPRILHLLGEGRVLWIYYEAVQYKSAYTDTIVINNWIISTFNVLCYISTNRPSLINRKLDLFSSHARFRLSSRMLTAVGTPQENDADSWFY